jgi:outer membrane immunogenic protein
LFVQLWRFIMRAASVYAVLVALVFTSQVQAGDLPSRTAPGSYGTQPSYDVAPVKSWQGCYAGAHAGAGFGHATHTTTSGGVVGAQAGCNLQSGHFVGGVEGDIGYADIDHTGFSRKFRQTWLGSVRARAGYAFDNNILAYGTAGVAFGGGQFKDPFTTSDNTHTGWVAGFGAEYKFTQNISGRAEFLHYDLGRNSYSSATGPFDVHPTTNVARVGADYHF